MAEITYIVNQGTPEQVQGTEVFNQSDKNLLQAFTVNSSFNSSKHLVELHILSLSDELIESDYNYIGYRILQGGQVGTEGASVISIDPIQDVRNYGYDSGGVKLLYHYYNDVFTTDKSTTDFYIQEISPDRTELRLNNLSFTSQELATLATAVKSDITSQSYFKELRLNFKNNDLFIVTNLDILYQGNTPTVVVKLYEPLPGIYSTKDTLSIVEFVSDSTVYEIDSTIKIEEERPTPLKSPNFNLDIADESVIPSQYFNYDELFSYQIGNSTNEIFSLFSEKGAEISVDHTNFEDFIHFSSAEERLLNFKYKLDLINSYSSSLVTLGEVSISQGKEGSIAQFTGLIEGVVNNFDHYERFLYYESGSHSWPKSTTVKPFINKTSTDQESIIWFNNKRSEALYFDNQNPHQLLNTVPTYLRDDDSNERYSIFIHMIGQHFDTLWLYSKAVTDKYDADNRLNHGISKDLVGEALHNFGIKLYTSNKSTEDLFSSFIGQPYTTGSELITNYVTGSLIGTGTPISPTSADNYQKEVQKRIYHNLSYLVKTKGTERGLRALINCFGIPSDILSIKQYGGRNTTQTPFYGNQEHYTSSLDKVRLDNNVSIVTGSTLSRYTTIIKKENKYTDDIHTIEVGFSPTDNIDRYIISKSLADPSLDTFNIDQYIGDPRDLVSNTYQGLQTVAEEVLGDLTQYDVRDYIRLIKFFDNTIFKMIKDFVPARSNTSTGIIIKPHILERSKAKSVEINATQPEYSGSIDTAYITASNGGCFGIQDSYQTSYLEEIQTPSGLGFINQHNHEEPKFDGELYGSEIEVTNGELGENNPYVITSPNVFSGQFNIWENLDNLCVLLPATAPLPNTVYLDNGIYYVRDGSTPVTDFFSGTGNNTNFAITSSTAEWSVNFPHYFTSSITPTGALITSSFIQYNTFTLSASKNTSELASCTQSINCVYGACELEQGVDIGSSIGLGQVYNVKEWIITSSVNTQAKVTIFVKPSAESEFTPISSYESLDPSALLLETVTFESSDYNTGDQIKVLLIDIGLGNTCKIEITKTIALCLLAIRNTFGVDELQGAYNAYRDISLAPQYLQTPAALAQTTTVASETGLASFFYGIQTGNIDTTEYNIFFKKDSSTEYPQFLETIRATEAGVLTLPFNLDDEFIEPNWEWTYDTVAADGGYVAYLRNIYSGSGAVPFNTSNVLLVVPKNSEICQLTVPLIIYGEEKSIPPQFNPSDLVNPATWANSWVIEQGSTTKLVEYNSTYETGDSVETSDNDGCWTIITETLRTPAPTATITGLCP